MDKKLLGCALLITTSVAFAEGGRFDNEFAWVNPAELDLTKKYEVTGGLIMPIVRIPLSGTQNFPSVTLPFVGPVPGTQQNVNVKITERYYLPGGKLAYRFNDKWIAGLVVGQNYLNDLTYPVDSPLQYSIWRSKVNGYNIAPSIAHQFSDKFTIGAGLDFLRMSAELKTDFGFGNTPPIPALSPLRTLPFTLAADGWQLGWHAGITAKPWLGSYIGLSYFSSMNVHVKGPVTTRGQADGDSFGSIERPDVVKLRVFQALNKDFGLIGSLSYIHWKDFKTIVANLPPAASASLQGTTQLTIPLFYRNSWIGEFGARKIYKKFTFVGMMRYAKTPINPEFRNISLPENNTWGSTLRGEYNFTDNISVFGRWSHIFQFNAKITPPPAGPTRPTLVANARPYADVFALGASYKA